MGDRNLTLTPNQEIILSALRLRRRYGLEIIEAIENSGGKQIGFNSLYPNLKKLEQKGLSPLSGVMSHLKNTPGLGENITELRASAYRRLIPNGSS